MKVCRINVIMRVTRIVEPKWTNNSPVYNTGLLILIGRGIATEVLLGEGMDTINK